MMEGSSTIPTQGSVPASSGENGMNGIPTINGGGGDVVSEGLAASMVKRVLTLKANNPLAGVTSLKSCFGVLRKEAPKVLDVKAYSKPVSSEQAISRIRANLAFFRVTYTAVFSTVLLVFVLSNPVIFIFSALLIALWSVFMSQPPDHVLKVGSVELKRNEKTIALVSLTIFTVVFGGLISSALYVIFVSGIVICAHGAFREPVVLDALEQLEQEGESIVKGDMV